MKPSKKIIALCAALLLFPAGCAPSSLDASASATIAQDYGNPVPARKAVEADWFSDTAMIGHSIMRGMELYSGLDTPDYYTLTGSSVPVLLSSREVTMPDGGQGRLEDALAWNAYAQYYLMMGINEISGDIDTLREDYLKLITTVRGFSPDATVYVLAVLPVTRNKAKGGTFSLKNITTYNEMLQQLCADEKCWYVDLYSNFADEEGYLPSSASSDGVHPNQDQYTIMKDYILTHTVE